MAPACLCAHRAWRPGSHRHAGLGRISQGGSAHPSGTRSQEHPARRDRAAAALGDHDPVAAPHLVVDEGQDLAPGFHGLVRIAASVTVFADECRRLTETNSTLTEITRALGRAAQLAEITGNHRNSREIASLVEQFRVGGSWPELPNRHGALPVLRHYSGTGDIVDDIAGTAARHPADRIGVIVDSLRKAADLMPRLERAGLAHAPRLYSSTATAGRYRDLDLARPG